MNNQETEESVVAYGMAVHDAAGRAVAAIAVSMPITRHREDRIHLVLAAMRAAVRAIESRIAEMGEGFDLLD